jgi:hypothetical protein
MAEPGGATRARLLPVVLLVSLGVNLFLAGSWDGTLMRPEFPPPPRPRHPQELVRDLQGRVGSDTLAKVEAAIADADRRIRTGPADPRRMEEALREILARDTFDGAAFLAAIDRFLDGRTENDKAIARHLAEVLAGIPLADRKVLAEVVLRPGARPPFGPPPGGMPPGPPPR